MSGSNLPPPPRERLRWKSAAKYLLAFAGVALLLWAIWSPDNRVQWVLTGILFLATWGVCLAIDHDERADRGALEPLPPQVPGTGSRANPVRSHREDRRHRRDERQA